MALVAGAGIALLASRKTSRPGLETPARAMTIGRLGRVSRSVRTVAAVVLIVRAGYRLGGVLYFPLTEGGTAEAAVLSAALARPVIASNSNSTMEGASRQDGIAPVIGLPPNAR